MPYFVAEARKLVKGSDISELQRATLNYMLQHCVGAENARTIDTVVAYLNNHGCEVDVRTFQHHVLGWSRNGNVYIASGRHGIYLIRSKSDAKPMMEFYEDRIAAESHRLEHLRELANARWPKV